MYKKATLQGQKPVYWCYTDETALAEAEIEYQDDPCTTIFVKFPIKTIWASWASTATSPNFSS